MTDDEIRSDLGRRIGAQIDERCWACLVKFGCIAEFHQNQCLSPKFERMITSLVDACQLPEPTPSVSVAAQSLLDGPSDLRNCELRDEIFSTILAAKAANEPAVRNFRSEVLKNKLLSTNHTDQWLFRHAQANDAAPDLWLQDVTVSATQYMEWVNEFSKRLQQTRCIDEVGSLHARIPVRIVPWGLLTERLMWRELPCVSGDREAGYDSIHTYYTYPGSMLERLRQIGADLARSYGWHEAEAVRFVLTGVRPRAPLMTAAMQQGMRGHRHGQVVLTIDLTVSPREVETYYRRLQHVYGGHTRDRYALRHQHLVRFVDAQPPQATWKDKWTAWNRQYPAWPYTQSANFARAYKHAIGQQAMHVAPPHVTGEEVPPLGLKLLREMVLRCR